MLLVYIIKHTSLIHHKMCFKLTQKALLKRTAEVRLFINNYKQMNCLLSLQCLRSHLGSNFQSPATTQPVCHQILSPRQTVVPTASHSCLTTKAFLFLTCNAPHIWKNMAVMNLSINCLNVRFQLCGSALEKYIQSFVNGSSRVIISVS